MVGAELAGSHFHQARDGTRVGISFRNGSYLARGRYRGQQFGETLGPDQPTAEAALRRVLADLDDDKYVVPKERKKRTTFSTRVPKLTSVELVNEYLAHVRKTKGQGTYADYRSRLVRYVEFMERPENRRAYRYASDITTAVATEFKAYLHTVLTTRNGKPGGSRRLLSPRQVHNILHCCRGAYAWAARPESAKLLAGFPNPFPDDVVGTKAKKDPFRKNPFPLEERVRLAGSLDCWELCTVGVALYLPVRPEELTGILISDVNLIDREIHFGERFGGNDFTKGRTSFTVPFPEELFPVIEACMNGRSEGPLLLRREIWSGEKEPAFTPVDRAALEARINVAMAACKPGVLQTPQDRKAVVRRVLVEAGGMDPERLSRSFRRAANRAGLTGVKLYDVRHAVSMEMKKAGVHILEEEYLTGHAVDGIMAEYVGLDPHTEMAKYTAAASSLLMQLVTRGHSLGCLQAQPDLSLAV
jgi:integrase